jgi:hypothetical protein
VIVAASTVGLVAAAPGEQPIEQYPASAAATSKACSASVTYDIRNEPIGYGFKTVDDSTLSEGQTKITTAGVNGEKGTKHKITVYDPSNCNISTDVVIEETVITQPVDQVTAVGTYVAPSAPVAKPSIPVNCSNGTYVNAAGNTVCSPYESPSAPVGATARCGDSSYSFSQSRSGTCSRHGGVAQWL